MLRLKRTVRAMVMVCNCLSILAAIAAPLTCAQERPSPEAHELARLILSSGLFDAASSQAASVGTAPVIVALQDRLKRSLSDEERSQLRSLMIQVMKDTLPWDVWEDLYADLYTKHASPAEITELLAFYKTPLGRRGLSLSVILATEAPEAGRNLAKSREKEFTVRFIDALGKTMPGLKAELDRSGPTR